MRLRVGASSRVNPFAALAPTYILGLLPAQRIEAEETR
jgi:hypothetical protein